MTEQFKRYTSFVHRHVTQDLLVKSLSSKLKQRHANYGIFHYLIYKTIKYNNLYIYIYRMSY